MSDFLTRINERLGYHRDNLTLWRNGTLTSTEPDEEERACTIRGLEAAIESLEIAKREYEADDLVQGLRVLFGRADGVGPDDRDAALNTLIVNILRHWDANLTARLWGALSSDGYPAHLDKILAERSNQDRRWGQQNHDGFIWLSILMEEVGELSEAVLHTRFRGPAAENVQAEAVQVAAVAMAMVECILRHEGTFPRSGEAQDA